MRESTVSKKITFVVVLVGLAFKSTKSSDTTENSDFEQHFLKDIFTKEANYGEENKTVRNDTSQGTSKDHSGLNQQSMKIDGLKPNSRTYGPKEMAVERRVLQNIPRTLGERNDKISKLLPRSLTKRDSASYERDEIFKQLEAELKSDDTRKMQTFEEEKQESDEIFRELLDELSTPKSTKPLDKESQAIQRVTDTVARLVLRNRNSGPETIHLVGVLANFLTSRFN